MDESMCSFKSPIGLSVGEYQPERSRFCRVQPSASFSLPMSIITRFHIFQPQLRTKNMEYDSLNIFYIKTWQKGYLLKHMVSMNRLDNASRVMVIRCLIEGKSIRSTV